MQATFSYESMEDMKSMYYEQKDVNTWFMFEKMTSNLQEEICEEIDREIIKKIKRRSASYLPFFFCFFLLILLQRTCQSSIEILPYIIDQKKPCILTQNFDQLEFDLESYFIQ